MNARSEVGIERRVRPFLGTFVEIRAGGLARAELEAVLARAFAQVARVQTLMSRFDSASDVARLNRSATGRAITVSAATWRVLFSAFRLSEISEGEFDVTVDACTQRGGWMQVELLPGRRVLRRATVSIDLGGIAKGYAVDRALAELRRGGCLFGAVNAGGDLRRFGPGSDTVLVRHPASPGKLVPIATLRSGAVATSGNYFDEQGCGRLKRPGGRPTWLGSGSVTVEARTCLIADALTKVVAAVGPEAAAPVLRRYHASAVAIRPDGRVFASGSHEVRHAA